MKSKIIILLLTFILVLSSIAFAFATAPQLAWSTWAYRPSGLFYMSGTQVMSQNAKMSTAAHNAWITAYSSSGDGGDSLEFEYRPINTSGNTVNPSSIWNSTTSGTATWNDAYYEFDSDDISLCTKHARLWEANTSYSGNMSLTLKSGVTVSTLISDYRFLFELERGRF